MFACLPWPFSLNAKFFYSFVSFILYSHFSDMAAWPKHIGYQGQKWAFSMTMDGLITCSLSE